MAKSPFSRTREVWGLARIATALTGLCPKKALQAGAEPRESSRHDHIAMILKWGAQCDEPYRPNCCK